MKRKSNFPRKEPRVAPWLFSHSWEQRKLGEVCGSLEYGLNAAAKEYDGENKYIRITDIDDNTRLFLTSDLTSPDTTLKDAARYRLEAGDIVFARTGASVGKSYIYKRSDGTVYYAGFLIRAKVKQEYSADFVFQNTLSQNYEKYILITSQRSGQPGVNAQEYAEYTFSVPEYEEQKKIGTFLTNLDRLITLHQRVQCVTSLLISWELDRFTIFWEQRKLGELGKAISGVGFPDSEQGGSCGVPFYKVSDMNAQGNEHEMTIANNYVTEEQIARRKWKPVSDVPAMFFAKVGAAVMLNRKRLVRSAFLLDNKTLWRIL